MRVSILMVAAILASRAWAVTSTTADVVIYGSTPAAITTAVAAQKMGCTAVIVSPEKRIGGMTTGGLGMTDVGNRAAYGGLALKFYRDIRSYYRDGKNWKWESPLDFAPRFHSYGQDMDDAMWLFTPSAALAVLERWEKDSKLDIRRAERLDRTTGGVVKRNGSLVSFRTLSGNFYCGKIFVDATYEGDLMAASGVSYFVGREDNAVYGETLSGFQPAPKHGGHRLNPGIDPYRTKGDPSSGLLPGVLSYEAVKNRVVGSGDKNLQAYNYRMCLTDVEANRIPFKRPEKYDEGLYELLFRDFEAGVKYLPRNQAKMPDRKTDTNNHGGFSTDFIGQNWSWPEATYEEREKIAHEHLVYQQGLMWTLANHPRIPAEVRAEFSKWGTCRDEFLDGPGDGWQRQIYVREARRMIGEYVMTEHNCRHQRVASRPIALAAYGMDSHNTMRYVGADGCVHNEGDIQDNLSDGKPYGIDYGSILPMRKECANLLVPVCLSASHIAFGSIRMEPVFFALGQAAGTAAALAVKKGVDVHDIDYACLRERLVSDGQYLEPKSSTVNMVVPYTIREATFDDDVRNLRRMYGEYGIRHVMLYGCPGISTRLMPWKATDERYERFASLMSRMQDALSDIDLELGWYCSPTITIGQEGPFQMMIGGDGEMARHAVCPLEKGFRDVIVRRVQLVARKTHPWMVFFEDETHFGWQRSVKKFTCYCPNHLKMVGDKIGRSISRDELVRICADPKDENFAIRAAFAESMRETMRVFGRELRKAVDDVSPRTRMGVMCTANLGRDGDALIAFAREIAGPGRPLVRNGASSYCWNGDAPEEIGCRMGNPLSEYENLPSDFETLLELDTYPRNHFFMSDAKCEGMLSAHIAAGCDGAFFHAVPPLDDPLEGNGYFGVWLRCGKKLNALKTAVQGKRNRGVQLVNKHESDNLFRYAGVPGLVAGSSIMSRFGIPFTTHEMSARFLVGSEAKRLSNADIDRLLSRGGVLMDGEAAMILCERGFEDLVGAHVATAPLKAAGELIRTTACTDRIVGRMMPNESYASVGTVSCGAMSMTKLREGVEVLADFTDSEGIPRWPSACRYINARGARVAVMAIAMSEDRSASIFNTRRRELMRNTFGWLANNSFGIYASVLNESNVFLFVCTTNDEREMVLTVVNMRMDILQNVEIEFCPWWREASIEEVDAAGVWNKGGIGGPYYPGQARIFRIRKHLQ